MNALLHRSLGLPLALAALALAACAGNREPAEHQIAAIESAIQAAQPEAGKYVPDQLADVETRLKALKADLQSGNYTAVLGAAPKLLTAAQELVGAAAVHKGEVLAELNKEWPALAGSLPQWLEALQKRVDTLGKGKKPPAGVDVPAAQAALGEALTLWGKAKAAFAAGNLQEAVDSAHTVKDKAAEAAAALKMPKPA
jgi:hypothetical protein